MYNSDATAHEALWHEACLAAQVRRVHRVVVRTYDHELRPHALTIAQLDLLMTLLTARAGMRRIDLARELEMERSTVTRNLDRLAARGLVASVPDDTGPAARAIATSAGRQVVEEAAEAWFRAHQTTRSKLGRDGVAALELLTRKLTDPRGD